MGTVCKHPGKGRRQERDLTFVDFLLCVRQARDSVRTPLLDGLKPPED